MLISMIIVKLREVFDVKKVVCCFVSIVFMLISLFVPVVSADDIAVASTFTVEDVNNLGFYGDFTDTDLQNIYNLSINPTFNLDNALIMRTENSFYFQQYNSSSNSWGYNVTRASFIVCTYYLKSYDDNYFYYSTYDFSSNHYYNLKSFEHSSIISPSLNFNTLTYENFCLFIRQSKSSNDVEFFYCTKDTIDALGVSDIQGVFAHERFLMNKNGTASRDYPYIPRFCNLGEKKPTTLEFSVNPVFTENMNLEELTDTYTISAINNSSTYYDYICYISESPSSIGIINSFNSSKWFMSSKQWCYQWLQDYSALNGSIEDYIADNIADGIKGADILDFTFGNGMYNSLVNAWGGAFDGMKEYFSVDDETMSFYQVSQTNCPVYRINPNDTKTHTISYSSLNLELGKTYYLNIIYMPVDFKAYSAMTAPIIDAGTGQQGNYPVFDSRNIAKYSVYDSYEFSVCNGIFSQDSNTLYSYSDLIKFTNPSKSTAKIESDDDEIIVSDNDSYDNSVSTDYINYGQIYHGCTFYNGTSGGSGGSGGLVEENIELKIYGVDDLDFELTQLSEPVSKFKLFMQSVFGFLPDEMVGLFILGISTCVICRILGR